MPMPRKPDPEKCCAHCGTALARKRFGPTLESMNVFLRRKYCNPKCMGASRVARDPPSRSTLHKRARAFRSDECSECGATSMLHVHHMDKDESNNSPSNCVTLCASCHGKWHWANGKAMPLKSAPACVICGSSSGTGRLHRNMCGMHYKRWRRLERCGLIPTGHGSSDWLDLDPEAVGQLVAARTRKRGKRAAPSPAGSGGTG